MDKWQFLPTSSFSFAAMAATAASARLPASSAAALQKGHCE
jgi:hypothetical protein